MYPTFNLTQAITLSVAGLGAVLGIINTWQGLDRSRLKLKVTPAQAFSMGPGANPSVAFCIEVTNLSTFAVTICEVGFLFKGTDDKGSVPYPLIFDGGKWPRRLEPRSSVTIYTERPTAPPGCNLRCAYATTQCGYRRTGTSPALKQLARQECPSLL